jgi:hypothetical protein
MNPRRTPARMLACAMAVASLGVAASAQAADPPSLCPPDSPIAADGSQSVGNQVGTAGCVVVRMTPGQGSALELVIPAAGWTSSVKSNGRSRIEVHFTNAATQAKAELRSEPGRLVVK